MPVEVTQRCSACGRMLDRAANFLSVAYDDPATLRKVRRWSKHCIECAEAKGELFAPFDSDDDFRSDKERASW